MAVLERAEARHNVILAILGAIADGQSSNIVTWSPGSPGECDIMTPKRPILLADLSNAQQAVHGAPVRRRRPRRSSSFRSFPRRAVDTIGL
jgi:hypothetical protein